MFVPEHLRLLSNDSPRGKGVGPLEKCMALPPDKYHRLGTWVVIYNNVPGSRETKQGDASVMTYSLHPHKNLHPTGCSEVYSMITPYSDENSSSLNKCNYKL